MDHTVPYASASHLMAVVSLVSAAVSPPVGPTVHLLPVFIYFFLLPFMTESYLGFGCVWTPVGQNDRFFFSLPEEGTGRPTTPKLLPEGDNKWQRACV